MKSGTQEASSSSSAPFQKRTWSHNVLHIPNVGDDPICPNGFSNPLRDLNNTMVPRRNLGGTTVWVVLLCAKTLSDRPVTEAPRKTRCISQLFQTMFQVQGRSPVFQSLGASLSPSRRLFLSRLLFGPQLRTRAARGPCTRARGPHHTPRQSSEARCPETPSSGSCTWDRSRGSRRGAGLCSEEVSLIGLCKVSKVEQRKGSGFRKVFVLGMGGVKEKEERETHLADLAVGMACS